MNVRKHSATGVAGGVAALPVAVAFGLSPLPFLGAVLAGSIVADIDHPQSSAARMWGPVSHVLAHVVSALSGGHRGVTHGRLPGPGTVALWAFLAAAPVVVVAHVQGVTVAAAVTVVAGFLAASVPVAVAFLYAFTFGLAFTAVDRLIDGRPDAHWTTNLTISTAVGVAAWWWSWPFLTGLAPGLALGWIIHLIGDRFRDQSWQARAFVAASFALAAAVAAWQLYPTLEGLTT